MRTVASLLCLSLVLLAGPAFPQNKTSINADFRIWLEQTIWPMAQAGGVSRTTFDAALSDVALNFELPDLVIPGAEIDPRQLQAEFRPPALYFAPDGLTYAADTGRALLGQHASALLEIEKTTGVPAQIILAIWGRESSFGKAQIPHDAFEILSTKGFLSTRAAYFTDELIAALQIVENGFAAHEQMKSSWAGALGQPQFMPSNYLQYATDGDGDGRADIWRSEGDTMASIAAYLESFGWIAGRDWGFEVAVPFSVPCYSEGPDQGRIIADWAAVGITRVSGAPFPSAEASAIGYLLMPAGRYGPAFIVTPNFYVLKKYNESDVYALFVGHVGDRMRYDVGGFQGAWRDLDRFSREDVREMQAALEGQGFDVGGADGLIGNKTRRSIGQWQVQNELAVTCYPSTETHEALVR